MSDPPIETNRKPTVIRRGLRRSTRALLTVLALIPWWRQPLRALIIDARCTELEDAGAFDSARQLRSQGFQELAPKFCGPLFRSEGFDRLQRRGDYQGALDAFEAAVRVMDQVSSLYGVTGPERVWYGAGVAALKVGRISDAQDYYARLAASLAQMPKWAKTGEGWRRYERCADWLKRELARVQPWERNG